MVFLLAIANLFSGYYDISYTDFFSTENNLLSSIVFSMRIKAILTATLCGIILALNGAILQYYFRNPLAGPYVLGITGSSALGVAIALLITQWFHAAIYSYIPAAILGAVVGLFMLSFFSAIFRTSETMLIVGFVLNTFSGSIVELIQTYLSKEALQQYTLWNLSTFRDCDFFQISILGIVSLITIGACFVVAPMLNIWLLGDEYASTKGVSNRQLKSIVFIICAIGTAIVTAYCGPVSFIGLAVPHIARWLFKTANLRALLPSMILLGIVICLSSLWISQWSFWTFTLPINAINGILGAIFMLYLIYRNRKNSLV